MKLKKLEIMKTRPEISDQEIHSMMDFDKVLNEHRSAKRKGNMRWIGGMLVLAVIISFYFLRPKEQPTVEIKKPEVVVLKKDSVEEEQVIESKTIPVKPKPSPAVALPSSPPTYAEAEPVSGYPELYSYFQKELKYPVEALKDSIEGIVSVSFVINKEGKPEQIKIQDSLGVPFDNEAIRVIESMPAWKPASMNGKPVPARISMPLTFQINRKSL